MRGRFLFAATGIAGIDAVSARSRHVFSRHSHEQFGIGVIRSGAQKSASGRGMVEAGAGDLITVNPGEVHDGAPIGDAARSWDMLYLDPAIVTGLLGDIHASLPGREFHFPVLGDRLAAVQFLQLFLHLREGKAEKLAVESALLDLVASLSGVRRDVETRMAPSALAMSRSRIDDDPAEDASLGELAMQAGMSRFQFLRAFSAATGFTPHAYRLQKRVDLARRLIRQRMALAEVAATSGFADQSHMTRIFVSKYGLTPGALAGRR